jgi:hypothetical protein
VSLLQPCVVEITANNSTSLVEKMKNGRCTAFEVVEAFCNRAAVADVVNVVSSRQTPGNKILMSSLYLGDPVKRCPIPEI